MKLVVLASGGGSNFQALIDDPIIRPHLAALVSNNPNAGCLRRAQSAGIETAVVDHRGFESRAEFDQTLAKVIDQYQPDWLVLAGFMRILTPEFVQHFADRALNIHPSLLPKFQGLHTHQRAIDAGESHAGVSVHLVTAELDGGPIIGQRSVPIQVGDDADGLAKRVLEQEHQLYPAVLHAIIDQRLTARENRLFLDDQELTDHGLF